MNGADECEIITRTTELVSDEAKCRLHDPGPDSWYAARTVKH